MSSSSSSQTLKPGDAVILEQPRLPQGQGGAEGHPSCRSPPRLPAQDSPDLNPIEQVFAKFKTLLRKAEARSYEAISDASGKILAQYPPAECAAYLKNAGYG